MGRFLHFLLTDIFAWADVFLLGAFFRCATDRGHGPIFTRPAYRYFCLGRRFFTRRVFSLNFFRAPRVAVTDRFSHVLLTVIFASADVFYTARFFAEIFSRVREIFAAFIFAA